ncbi:MAG: NAD(P)H-hydrate dehydratase [Pirellulaceae bacterium]
MTVELVEDLPPLPERPTDGHKGTFGSVLVVAGSRGMSGAASLCGQAALHGGAGLVTVACPESIVDVVASGHPSYMTAPLLGSRGYLAQGSVGQIEQLQETRSVMALGPGLGQEKSVQGVVHHLYCSLRQPIVLDADGLNAFVGSPALLGSQGDPRILTPHPGEFARLLGKSTSDVQANRQSLAVDFARELGLVLVLKGAQTLVTDGKRCFVCPVACTALATGGSGDVLTGLIAALLAQGMTPFEAATLGVHLHGRAGESASEKYSDFYSTSLEILHCLSDAFLRHIQTTAS